MHDFGFDFECVLCILVLCKNWFVHCTVLVFSPGREAPSAKLPRKPHLQVQNGSLGQTAEGLGSVAEWNSSNMHPHFNLAATEFFLFFCLGYKEENYTTGERVHFSSYKHVQPCSHTSTHKGQARQRSRPIHKVNFWSVYEREVRGVLRWIYPSHAVTSVGM